jgi:hypothetical protein
MDPIRGKTVRWIYDDGPMKGKTFEHAFGADGTVTWKEAGEAKPLAESTAKYETVRINDDVYVVAYLSGHGWTLTTIVDTKSGSIVSFASNEKELVLQHGKLDTARRAA